MRFINTDTSTTHYFKSKANSTRKDINDAMHNQLGPSMESPSNGNIEDKRNSSDKDINSPRSSASYRPLLTKSDSIHDLDCNVCSFIVLRNELNFSIRRQKTWKRNLTCK